MYCLFLCAPSTKIPLNKTTFSRLLYLFLGVSGFCLFSDVWADKPRIIIQSSTSTLQRGKPFTWKGYVVRGARAKLHIHWVVRARFMQKKRVLFSRQVSIDARGAFTLKGHIPSDVNVSNIHVELSLWKPKHNTPKQPQQGAAKVKRPSLHNTLKSHPSRPKKHSVSKKNRISKRSQSEPSGSKESSRPRSMHKKIRRLLKQLRKGWSSGKNVRQKRKKLAKQRKRSQFLLPPVPSQSPNAQKDKRARSPAQSRTKPLEHHKENEDRHKHIRTKKYKAKLTDSQKMKESKDTKLNPKGSSRRRRPEWPSEQFHRREDRSARVPGAQNRRKTRRTPSLNGRSSPSTPQSQNLAPHKPKEPTMLPSSPQRKLPRMPKESGEQKEWTSALKTRLDRNTKGGNTYLRQVFTPYLAHHQRITSLDRVRRGYRFVLSSKRRSRIQVGGVRIERRSYFVGRIRIALVPGRWTPIPSVAPDARILWYKTEPPIQLYFAKNKGDIVLVRARQTRSKHVMLVFGTDGNTAYFGGSIRKRIFPHSYPRWMRPRMPYRVRRTILRTMHRMGLRRRMSLRQAMHKIVPYLRRFSPTALTPKEDKKDLYISLVSARKGVCRHRAMIFTVTMQALGYPARFVSNNAHAFAEIQYPDGQWRQVDLGGGDMPHYMGQWKGRAFRPPSDPFPKPPPIRTRRTPLPPNTPGRRFRRPTKHAKSLPLRPSTPQKRKRRKRSYVSHTRIE